MVGRFRRAWLQRMGDISPLRGEDEVELRWMDFLSYLEHVEASNVAQLVEMLKLFEGGDGNDPDEDRQEIRRFLWERSPPLLSARSRPEQPRAVREHLEESTSSHDREIEDAVNEALTHQDAAAAPLDVEHQNHEPLANGVQAESDDSGDENTASRADEESDEPMPQVIPVEEETELHAYADSDDDSSSELPSCSMDFGRGAVDDLLRELPALQNGVPESTLEARETSERAEESQSRSQNRPRVTPPRPVQGRNASDSNPTTPITPSGEDRNRADSSASAYGWHLTKPLKSQDLTPEHDRASTQLASVLSGQEVHGERPRRSGIHGVPADDQPARSDQVDSRKVNIGGCWSCSHIWSKFVALCRPRHEEPDAQSDYGAYEAERQARAGQVKEWAAAVRDPKTTTNMPPQIPLPALPEEPGSSVRRSLDEIGDELHPAPSPIYARVTNVSSARGITSHAGQGTIDQPDTRSPSPVVVPNRATKSPTQGSGSIADLRAERVMRVKRGDLKISPGPKSSSEEDVPTNDIPALSLHDPEPSTISPKLARSENENNNRRETVPDEHQRHPADVLRELEVISKVPSTLDESEPQRRSTADGEQLMPRAVDDNEDPLAEADTTKSHTSSPVIIARGGMFAVMVAGMPGEPDPSRFMGGALGLLPWIFSPRLPSCQHLMKTTLPRALPPDMLSSCPDFGQTSESSSATTSITDQCEEAYLTSMKFGNCYEPDGPYLSEIIAETLLDAEKGNELVSWPRTCLKQKASGLHFLARRVTELRLDGTDTTPRVSLDEQCPEVAEGAQRRRDREVVRPQTDSVPCEESISEKEKRKDSIPLNEPFPQHSSMIFNAAPAIERLTTPRPPSPKDPFPPLSQIGRPRLAVDTKVATVAIQHATGSDLERSSLASSSTFANKRRRSSLGLMQSG